MKKNYQNPETTIVKVRVQHLLTDSINMGGSQGNFNSSSGTQLSREGRGSSWDDDED
jgi:hypothetical protein